MQVAIARTEPEHEEGAAPAVTSELAARLVELRPELIQIAAQWTRDPLAAEDLFQDMAVRALKSRARFRPGSNLKAWAACIMRNLFVDGYRRQLREAPLDFEVEVTIDLPDDPALADLVSMEDVRSVLATLSEGDRMLFTLWSSRELSYDQMARLLGVHPTTVGTRLYRLRARLRRRLEHMYELRFGRCGNGVRSPEEEVGHAPSARRPQRGEHPRGL
jgi:RNA polymerase sigma-70 factor, ECF subfamily